MTSPLIPSSSDITGLLEQVRAGDPVARDLLFSSAYGDLRRLARARMRGAGCRDFLATTVLVHECYLRIAGAPGLRAADRKSFFAYASTVMRSVIVEDVRARMTARRGGAVTIIPLDTGLELGPSGGEDLILRVHEALLELEQADERLGQVVQLRFFGGFDEGEIAQTLGISERTVRRDWEKAKLILVEVMR